MRNALGNCRGFAISYNRGGFAEFLGIGGFEHGVDTITGKTYNSDKEDDCKQSSDNDKTCVALAALNVSPAVCLVVLKIPAVFLLGIGLAIAVIHIVGIGSAVRVIAILTVSPAIRCVVGRGIAAAVILLRLIVIPLLVIHIIVVSFVHHNGFLPENRYIKGFSHLLSLY